MSFQKYYRHNHETIPSSPKSSCYVCNQFFPTISLRQPLSINIDSLCLFSFVTSFLKCHIQGTLDCELFFFFSGFFYSVYCLWSSFSHGAVPMTPSLLLTSFPTYWYTTCCWALELLPCLLVSSIVLQRTVIYKSLMNICCYVFLDKYLVVRLLHYIPNLYLTL